MLWLDGLGLEELALPLVISVLASPLDMLDRVMLFLDEDVLSFEFAMVVFLSLLLQNGLVIVVVILLWYGASCASILLMYASYILTL